jgi:hypothetical protein
VLKLKNEEKYGALICTRPYNKLSDKQVTINFSRSLPWCVKIIYVTHPQKTHTHTE